MGNCRCKILGGREVRVASRSRFLELSKYVHVKWMKPGAPIKLAYEYFMLCSSLLHNMKCSCKSSLVPFYKILGSFQQVKVRLERVLSLVLTRYWPVCTRYKITLLIRSILIHHRHY